MWDLVPVLAREPVQEQVKDLDLDLVSDSVLSLIRQLDYVEPRIQHNCYRKKRPVLKRLWRTRVFS